MSANVQRRVLVRLLRVAAPRWRIAALAFGCMAVLGATTGVYAYLIGPALRFLLTGGEATVAFVDRERALWLLPAAIVAVGVVKGAAYLGQFYWMGLFGQRVAGDLRRAVFEALARIPPTRLPQQRAGDLLTRFSADVTAIEVAATYTLGSYVRDSLQIVILIGVALWLNWQIALGALIVLPLAVLPAARLTRTVMRRTRVGQAKLGELSAQLQEALVGVRTIQAFNGQAAERVRFEDHARVQRTALIRAGWARGAVPGVMEILAATAIAVTLSFAISRQAVPPEELVSVLTALVLVYQPAKDLGRVTQFGVQALAAGERVDEVLQARPAVVDPPGAGEAGPPRERIVFEDVWFSYGDRPALRGVTLEVPVGRVTALVGPSGSGKSTLAALLLRFEPPDRGTLRFDGVDLGTVRAASVRAHLALVSQEAQLFSASVRENLLLARPDATDAELEAAAKVAAADGFIRALPRGYDTPIGERGVVLSGGQRQRLALARAVLRRAEVLVLDEATSNLDPQGEREVIDALRPLWAGKTAVVIAHRLSTIQEADVIYVLDGGRVVEQGRHPELLAQGGVYARLWALQDARESAA